MLSEAKHTRMRTGIASGSDKQTDLLAGGFSC
jgi:hypothetical protein